MAHPEIAALGLALLAAMPVQARPARDRAGNRIVAFAVVQDQAQTREEGGEGPETLHCTAERRWCARLALGDGGSQWRLEVFEGLSPHPDSAEAGRSLPLDMDYDNARFTLRGEAVATNDGALLIGIERYSFTGYAGGGASATVLQIVRAARGRDPAAVLQVPIGAAKDIRACFDSDDRRARRDACADRYDFDGRLALDPATASGPPRFVLTTRARTYPGRRTLESDSTTEPPLRRGGLVWARDPQCSYRRLFTANADGRYAPDRPLPACSDYLDF